MTRQRPVTYTLFFTVASILFLLFLFILDPIRALGWVLIPVHQHHAERYMTSLQQNDFTSTAASTNRGKADQTEWIDWMETLQEQDFSVVQYSNLKVPYDRERMDGMADVTFHTNGNQETYRIRMNFALNGVKQACIVPEETEFARRWNAVQCRL
ncbi:hypothetical protein ACFQ88_22025 [Paenibacillus sp. NPDC056579]|uniref:hypothetical protein n=1 Tax=Paenibacillus sp. NPDC056579 TaxID=3345871 RepID=UPI0036B1F49D